MAKKKRSTPVQRFHQLFALDTLTPLGKLEYEVDMERYVLRDRDVKIKIEQSALRYTYKQLRSVWDLHGQRWVFTPAESRRIIDHFEDLRLILKALNYGHKLYNMELLQYLKSHKKEKKNVK